MLSSGLLRHILRSNDTGSHAQLAQSGRLVFRAIGVRLGSHTSCVGLDLLPRPAVSVRYDLNVDWAEDGVQRARDHSLARETQVAGRVAVVCMENVIVTGRGDVALKTVAQDAIPYGIGVQCGYDAVRMRERYYYGAKSYAGRNFSQSHAGRARLQIGIVGVHGGRVAVDDSRMMSWSRDIELGLGSRAFVLLLRVYACRL
ncbi:hypothetical protein PENSPDRAFT_148716 [Peniophora sp. CONT]|nr:hypothetical protein PENSPDRAFT_148716 [Peniophora sp. CONT]